MFIRNLILLTIVIISNIASAATFKPVDYLVAGQVGDTWNYVDQIGGNFTWTLEEITVGVNAGRMKLGNANSSIIYDVVNDVVTWYEISGEILNPPVSFAESYETDQVYSIGDTEVIFSILPSMTVQTVTYNDVLVVVWLDRNYPSNTMNITLGLDPSVASSVTDVDWWAKGVGNIKYFGVDAATGNNDGAGSELISYSFDSAQPASGDGGGGLIVAWSLLLLVLMNMFRYRRCCRLK